MMTQRAQSVPISASCYEDMPFGLVLFRYLWPFWLLKDASSGDRYARAAAYRHNRDMRVYLPGYMGKWIFNSAATYAFVAGADSLSSRQGVDVFTLLTAAAAVALACSLVVVLVTGYVYMYLDRNDV